MTKPEVKYIPIPKNNEDLKQCLATLNNIDTMTSTLGSMNDLNRLCELIYKHRLLKEVILYMDITEYNKTNQWLKNLGSGSTASVKLDDSNPELECTSLKYNNINFYIVQY